MCFGAAPANALVRSTASLVPPLAHTSSSPGSGRSSKRVAVFFSFFDTSSESIPAQARVSGRASMRPWSATAVRARSSPLRLSGVSSRCNHGHASHSRCSISASTLRALPAPFALARLSMAPDCLHPEVAICARHRKGSRSI